MDRWQQDSRCSTWEAHLSHSSKSNQSLLKKNRLWREFSGVAVLDKYGNIVETGFVFSENHTLTCAHVIHATGAKSGAKVGIQLEADTSLSSALISAPMNSVENDMAALSFSAVTKTPSRHKYAVGP
jgi:hypothetical protein